jgi:predicted  nucleic acid-binding Zn-ribbon protein
MTKNTRNKILLHACPRCQGDLFPDSDDVGFYGCLQCGRTIAETQILAVAAEERREPALAAAA